jgi:hypothetical protein
MSEAAQIAKPSVLKDADIGRFWSDGFLAFPSLLNRSTCDVLCREIDHFEDKRMSVAVGLPAHAALASLPVILAIASDLMAGTDFGFHHLHTARHTAGTPDLPWHHDYEQYPQVDRKFTMLHFFMYLSGLNGTIGDLLTIPGSHTKVMDRYVHSRSGTIDLPGTLVINNLPEGSVVAIHSALLHARRAKPGGEDRPRYFTDVSYCQAGTVWPAYLERGNWRETLAHLKARDDRLGGQASFLFDPSRFREIAR